MAALFAESPNTFVTQDCAMRRPASKRSLNAWPGGFLGNSPLIVALSRTLISQRLALSMGSAALGERRCGATKAAGAASSVLSGAATTYLIVGAAAGGRVIDHFAAVVLC